MMCRATDPTPDNPQHLVSASYAVCGQVQGVGFRPFVKRLADGFGLSGHVCNVDGFVEILVYGTAGKLAAFKQNLQTKLPVNARITRLIELSEHAPSISSLTPEPGQEVGQFHISTTASRAFIDNPALKQLDRDIPNDRRICNRCINELFDSNSRRYHFPFINCTDCGPRYSVLRSLPYVRQNTSWSDFPPCDECLSEFNEIDDLRFHAEGISCNACGPRMGYTGTIDSKKNISNSSKVDDQTTNKSIAQAAATIAAQKICAVKGMGGFHLMCDAKNLSSIDALRNIKQRPAKPFALMALNTQSLKNIAEIDTATAAQLNDKSASITLAPKAPSPPRYVEACAPNLNSIGCVLPYSGTHFLLFYYLLGCPEGNTWLTEACDIFLVVTSANNKDEPILANSVTQLTEQTKWMFDVSIDVLDHPLEIINTCDDSVLFAPSTPPTPQLSHAPQSNSGILRMARGLSPYILKLPKNDKKQTSKLKASAPQSSLNRLTSLPKRCYPTVLALGADLKHTFCVITGSSAYVSPQTGSLSSDISCRQLITRIESFLDLLCVKPDLIACDQHPDFFSSELASLLAKKYAASLYSIQHHHAHIGSLLAERGETESVMAFALDGMGYGENGALWGGECLQVSPWQSNHIAQFEPLALPGGDQANRQIWRIGYAALSRLDPLMANRHYQELMLTNSSADSALDLIDKTLSYAPTTSSLGRWFDAFASALGVVQDLNYEAQGAMYLEALSLPYHQLPSPKQTAVVNEHNNLDLYPVLLTALTEPSRSAAASRFHSELIDGITRWFQALNSEKIYRRIYISGGCLQNQILKIGLQNRMSDIGIELITSENMPSNDASIALGQAWVATHLHAGEAV